MADQLNQDNQPDAVEEESQTPIIPANVNTMTPVAPMMPNGQPMIPNPSITVPVPNSPVPVAAAYNQPKIEEFTPPEQPPVPQKPAPTGLTTQQMLENTYTEEEKANRRIATAAKQQADAQNQIQREKAINLMQNQKDVAELQRKSDDALQLETEKLRGIQKDILNQPTEIKDFWANKSTGQKILGAISIVLGGLAGGASGRGGNAALDVIDKAIDNDIKKQQFDMQMKGSNLKTAAGMQENLISQMRSKFKDDTLARMAAKDTMIQLTQAKMEELASRYESGTVKDRYNIVNQQLEQQRLALHQQMEQQVRQKAMMQELANVGGEPTALNPAQAEMLGLPEHFVKAYNETQARRAPGFQGIAPSAKEAQEFRSMKTNHDTLKQTLQEIVDLGNKNGGKFNPIEKARIKSLATKVIPGLLKNAGVSRTTTPEIEAFTKDVLGNPGALFQVPGKSDAAIKQLIDNMDKDMAIHAKGLGYTPMQRVAQPGFKPNK